MWGYYTLANAKCGIECVAIDPTNGETTSSRNRDCGRHRNRMNGTAHPSKSTVWTCMHTLITDVDDGSQGMVDLPSASPLGRQEGWDHVEGCGYGHFL